MAQSTVGFPGAQDAKSDKHKVITISDFTRILGISRPMQTILYHQGIRTYQDLASTPAAEIHEITARMKTEYRNTWSQQARLILERPSALREYQYQLKTRTGPQRRTLPH